MLRSLDAELQRIQQLEAFEAATAPAVPIATPVDELEIGPGKEAQRIRLAEHEVTDLGKMGDYFNKTCSKSTCLHMFTCE